MRKQTSGQWYRQPAMIFVAGVLSFTLISGTAMLTFALRNTDTLVVSDEVYQSWRDEMRATTAAPEDDD